eukprot:GHVS01103272.1.p1 GENE.GHVS01103272.1~~GHVS01103272.1.p1  ORF type:complete len:117 (+),score=15.79 GHVS01103272.1:261-611(+)
MCENGLRHGRIASKVSLQWHSASAKKRSSRALSHLSSLSLQSSRPLLLPQSPVNCKNTSTRICTGTEQSDENENERKASPPPSTREEHTRPVLSHACLSVEPKSSPARQCCTLLSH